MHLRNRISLLITCAVLVCSVGLPVVGQARQVADSPESGANWGQWRGPDFDNVSAAKNLPTSFDSEKNLAWKFELPGPGGASPVVWGENLFVTTVNEDDDSLELLCLNSKTGKLNWKQKLEGANRKIRMDQANLASPSPCTDGQHVWANTAAGFLQCFDMSGKQVWNVDLQDRYGKFNIQFGMSSTPILDGDRIYLQLIHGNMRARTTSQGWVVALNAKTGDEVWKHRRLTDGTAENKHSYASPILVRDENVEYLVTHGGDYIIGHSLEDGSELWRCGGLNPKGDGYNPYLRFVASPTFCNGKLFVPSAKNGPVFCLNSDLSGDVTEKDSALTWVLKKGTPDVSSPLIAKGLIFLARENGVVLCLDEKTGEKVYETRMLADKQRSTPVFADDKVFITGRRGKVLVLSPDREGTVLAENELGEEIKSSPAVVDGFVFIRTSEAIYAFAKQ